QLETLGVVELLGVVEPGQPGPHRQHRGAGHDRAGERPEADLVDARHDLEAHPESRPLPGPELGPAGSLLHHGRESLVKRELPPVPRFTRPSKPWIRSRVPSTTLAWTRMVSPGRSAGTVSLNCSFSICSITFMTVPPGCRGFRPGRACAPAPAPASRLRSLDG